MGSSKKKQESANQELTPDMIAEMRKQTGSHPKRRRDAMLNMRIFKPTMDALTTFAAMNNMTKTEVVEAAVSDYIHRKFEDPYGKREAYLSKTLGEIKDLNRLQAEAFYTFLQYWFAHTPRIPEDLRAEANAEGHERFQAFLRYMNQTMLTDDVGLAGRFLGDQPDRGMKRVDDVNDG
ncbi:MAG: hypothetical protein RI826_08760 [Chlorobium phaeovibrioides]|nr:hypothetical protein [Chlorobium phaeovibrioides]